MWPAQGAGGRQELAWLLTVGLVPNSEARNRTNTPACGANSSGGFSGHGCFGRGVTRPIYRHSPDSVPGTPRIFMLPLWILGELTRSPLRSVPHGEDLMLHLQRRLVQVGRGRVFFATETPHN